MGGSFNIFSSRREYTEVAKFWSKKDNKTLNQIVYSEIPTAVFNCRQVNATQITAQDIQQNFRYSEASLTISTQDNIGKMRVDDIVKFRDTFYRVEEIQKTPIRNSTHFGTNNVRYEFFVVLVGKE